MTTLFCFLKMLYLYHEIMLIRKGNYFYVKTLRVIDKIKFLSFCYFCKQIIVICLIGIFRTRKYILYKSKIFFLFK